MSKESAGLLLYRRTAGQLEVFLVHPGGPFWAKKDAGAWTIPKGERLPGEDPWQCAERELREETGVALKAAAVSLGTIRQAGGKLVHAFAAAADVDPATIVSNRFQIEWPPHSGKTAEYPEVDRAAWFGLTEAAAKINRAQAELLRRLAERVGI